MSSEKITDIKFESVRKIEKDNKSTGIEEVDQLIKLLSDTAISLQLRECDVLRWIEEDFKNTYRNSVQNAVRALNVVIYNTKDFLIEPKKPKEE